MGLSRNFSENLRLPQLSSGSFLTRHIASVNGQASVESTKILAAFAGYLALTSFSCLHQLHWLCLSLMTVSAPFASVRTISLCSADLMITQNIIWLFSRSQVLSQASTTSDSS